jgi:hypothetical protein
MANKIEIIGLKDLMKAFDGLPKEIGPSVIRNIARKPANKVTSIARSLFKFIKTGYSKRTIGVKRVKDRMQPYLEVGIKGRSLVPIFIKGAKGRKRKSGAKTGDIKPIGNIITEAADKGLMLNKEMAVDLSKHIARSLKRYIK